MAVQARVNNTNLPLCLKDGKTRDNFTVKQYVTGVLLKGQVMGKEMVIIGTATADGGNTGNGIVTELALSAIGAPAKVGNYILSCTDESIEDTIAAGNISGPTGTGNGTLTELAPDSLGAPAKKGSWILTCIETITNGGRFQLADPDGIIVASDILIAAGAGGVIVFVGAGLTFKITDGGTDFVAGDYFGFDVTGTHGGRFQLADPDGIIIHDKIDIAAGAGGVIVYTGAGITFKITDGGTDFADDDFFTITVTAGIKLIPVTDAATIDGSQLPLYILGEEVDATGGDITGEVAYIEGDFDAQQLAFEGTATLATDIKIGTVEKTIREWLQDVGIVAIDSTYPDGFENT